MQLLNDKSWEFGAEGTVARRFYDAGNIGLIKLQPEVKKLQGKLVLGVNWGIEDAFLAIFLETEEFLLLKNSIDAIGRNYTENDYIMTNAQNVCKQKQYANGTKATVIKDTFHDVFEATVVFPCNPFKITLINHHTLVIRTNEPLLVWPSIDYLCTADDICAT